jgi:hypothetical protein
MKQHIKSIAQSESPIVFFTRYTLSNDAKHLDPIINTLAA